MTFPVDTGTPRSFQVRTSHLTNLGNGYVFSFGSNQDGQLGIGDSSVKFSTAPLLVSEFLNPSQTGLPVQVSCGGRHTVVVTDSGEVYAWGRNTEG